MRRFLIIALAVAALVLTIGGVQVLDRPGGALSASSSWASAAQCNSNGHSGYGNEQDFYDPESTNIVRLEVYHNTGFWCVIATAVGTSSAGPGAVRDTDVQIETCTSLPYQDSCYQKDEGDYAYYAGPVYVSKNGQSTANVYASRSFWPGGGGIHEIDKGYYGGTPVSWN